MISSKKRTGLLSCHFDKQSKETFKASIEASAELGVLNFQRSKTQALFPTKQFRKR